MPMFDFDAKPISAFVFEMQLKIVVFPVLVKPMIPQFSAMMRDIILDAKIRFTYRVSMLFSK
jgi:hypothetical protein